MWSMKIIRVDNGYKIQLPPESKGEVAREFVIEDDDTDELKSHEELLWQVMEVFAFGGSKHDKVRLRVVRESSEEDFCSGNGHLQHPSGYRQSGEYAGYDICGNCHKPIRKKHAQ